MLNKIFHKLMISTTLLILSTSTLFAKTFQHSMGTIDIDGVPQRVVVLGFGSLDFIDALGVTPIAMPKKLLPSNLSKYKADEFVNTGSLQEVNYETLFTLKPDLIISEARMAKLYPDLAAIAPTYMMQIDSHDFWKTTSAHWRNLSEILGKKAEGEALIATIQAQIDELHEKMAQVQPKTLTVMSNGGNVTMFGPISRFSFIYNEAGMQPSTSDNIASETGNHGNLISFEYIADAKPDVLLILDRAQAIGAANGQAKELFDNALIESTPAAKNDRLVYLDASAWYLTAGGYQSTQVMINDLNRAIR